MAERYVYVDETGDVDLTGSTGSSSYFGFGTATFTGDHGEALWRGLQLRCALEARGVRVPAGLHAKNDSRATRGEVFDLIAQQRPRFDSTFLAKAKAFESVRARGPVYLYQLAWFLHFKGVLLRVSDPGDTVYVIAATLKLNRKADSAREALRNVCDQTADDRTVILCNWDAATSWGIQVADYLLWAAQRDLEGRPCEWYLTHVASLQRSRFRPWGT